MKYSFDALTREATERGMRLERGHPDKPHGMQSGYIVWKRNGLWHQIKTLHEVWKSIHLGKG